MGQGPRDRCDPRDLRLRIRSARLERIGLFFYDGNDRARRAYEKAGFAHEGTMRRAHFSGGEHHDVHVMGLLRSEWQALPHPRSWESD